MTRNHVSRAKSARTTKPARARIASRTDVQFVGAFTAGCLTPFAGGALAAVVSTLLWDGAANVYTDGLNVILNGAIFASVALVYLVGFMATAYLLAHLNRLRLPLVHATRALLPVGLCAIASIAFSLQSASLGPSSSVVIDLLSLILFGFGYVLGWWAVRRYAKL
jgi:hypothetical protein